MNGSWLGRARTSIAGAAGVTILLWAPLLAQADQGKWWNPKEGNGRSEQGDQGNRREDRGNHRGWQERGNGQNRGGQGGWRDRGTIWRPGNMWRDRATHRVPGPSWRDRNPNNRGVAGDRWGSSGDIRFRDRRYSARGSWGGTSVWRGYPVKRDVLVIRDNRYGGGYFRARRIYCAPRYYGRAVYVRPVRFYVAANLRFGGVRVGARIVRPHYLYGCNFCDERFDSYEAYAYHVRHCPYAPHGFLVSVSNWDDDFDSYWDEPYYTNDGYYDQGYDEDPYYDDSYDYHGDGYDDEE